LIAETRLGKLLTKLVFRIIANDFIKSLNQQNLPQTIPTHSFSEALSGALHVEPPGYLDCVKSGQIKIIRGTIDHIEGRNIHVRGEGNGIEKIEADNILLATGYKVVRLFPIDAE
jgi:pyruvate/2-oxoglutarate dehydrogenase complex dihydrolipoamide dehydrogenase (E3) component